MALFSCRKICKIAIIVLSFVFENYCPIMDKLVSKDLSRKLQAKCVISYLLFIFKLCLVHEFFWLFSTVTLMFVFDNYYLIMD